MHNNCTYGEFLNCGPSSWDHKLQALTQWHIVTAIWLPTPQTVLFLDGFHVFQGVNVHSYSSYNRYLQTFFLKTFVFIIMFLKLLLIVQCLRSAIYWDSVSLRYIISQLMCSELRGSRMCVLMYHTPLKANAICYFSGIY